MGACRPGRSSGCPADVNNYSKDTFAPDSGPHNHFASPPAANKTRISGLLHGQKQALLHFALFHHLAVGIGDYFQNSDLLVRFADKLKPAAATAVVQT